jgi:hypothetical protein
MGEGVNIVQRPPKMSFSTRRTSRLVFSFFFLEALGMMNVVSVYIDKLLNQQSFALLARMMVDCCYAPLPHTYAPCDFLCLFSRTNAGFDTRKRHRAEQYE